jgi:hypothetical protein
VGEQRHPAARERPAHTGLREQAVNPELHRAPGRMRRGDGNPADQADG